jgi:ubiquinone biosynthesis protein COQ9
VLLDSDQTKRQILSEFLKICVFEGWNNNSLLQALANCNIGAKFADLIFENGCLDVAEFYIEIQNQKAAAEIAKIENFELQKVRDKIRLALYARFAVEKNNQIVLQRLINFYFNLENLASVKMGPKPLLQSLKSCYKIADFIWNAINDQSTDFNFYTKRLTLSKIILRSLRVFVQDKSGDFTATKNFIDLEIAKVMKFEKCKLQLKKYVGEIFLDEKGELKSPKNIIKNLPFIRLIKF